MRNLFAASLLALGSLAAQACLAQTDGAGDDRHPLADRAASSDIVVVAQLDQTDYEYERSFPYRGEAWFRRLITYKSGEALKGLIVVPESGLGDDKCYFTQPEPWDEGPRYLLFLVHDEESDTTRGNPDGCSIEILVTTENRYAARWPQPGFGAADGRDDETLAALAEPMMFIGPGARIDASEMLNHQRRERAERNFMTIDGTDLIPTRGIEISELRRLMQPGLEIAEGSAQERDRVRVLREQMLQPRDDSEDPIP